MSSRHRPATIVVALIIGFGFAAPLATTPPVHASEPALAVFDGFAASQSVYMEPRSNAVFALPANQLIGATHAEINSQPRAQGYAATYGVPLAQNARGVGIPLDYHGQCYANYPGEPKVDCGIPFSDAPPPSPPSGGPFSGDAFKAHAEASGSNAAPDATRASGVTEAGGLSGGDPFRIGWSRSESKSFVENGVLHAVTASVRGVGPRRYPRCRDQPGELRVPGHRARALPQVPLRDVRRAHRAGARHPPAVHRPRPRPRIG